jgi:hypothetical protein
VFTLKEDFWQRKKEKRSKENGVIHSNFVFIPKTEVVSLFKYHTVKNLRLYLILL